MKKIIILMLPLLFAFQNQANARARIPFGKAEKLDLVKDLPNTENYLLENGNYLDLAQFYETFQIAWVPLWTTKEPVLVGYDKTLDEYYDIPEEELNGILTENELKSEDLLGLGLWPKLGGKAILLVILGFFGWGYFGKDDDEEEAKEETSVA
jgi:hypothetical protein